MIAAVLSLTLLGLFLGYLLGLAARHFHVEVDPRVQQVESLLPGSQCGQCGFPGCSQAALAVVRDGAPVTLCPPGGKALAEALAELLNRSFDPDAVEDGPPRLAQVEESICIGCIKCLRTCPTDAIVGAPKQIHVVMHRACTGCASCIDVCPTGALRMIQEAPTLGAWRWHRPEQAAA